MENTFFIDNVEIPNINHFPTQAPSGGPIGMLNVDFIKVRGASPPEEAISILC